MHLTAEPGFATGPWHHVPMSLPRLFLDALPTLEGQLVPLGPEAARHLKALRLKPGAALELVLGDQAWTADLTVLARGQAVVRLVAPLREEREPPMGLQACLPLPAQLSLFDEWLPPLVELGATLIQPVVDAARKKGMDVVGPLAADTLFHYAYAGDYDVVVAMYHDQGLCPLKMVAFDSGVNWTLGLPFIRTSPDHGTAYDIAGKNKANPSSMRAAIRLAKLIAQNRSANRL